MTVSERVKKFRETRTDKGGHRIDVMLTPKAAAKMAKWRLRGVRIAEVVNSLLEASKP